NTNMSNLEAHAQAKNVKISTNLQSYASTCKSQFNDLDDKPCDLPCLLCDTSFTLPTKEQDFLTHLFNEHRLVIGDVKKIASLKSYIRYWRVKFKEQPLTTFCTTLTAEKKDSASADSIPGIDDFYFLLSDCLMEDKTLRDELRRAKLEWVLAEQVKERSDLTFKRGCMFCREEFEGSRIEYLKHLCQKHNIFLGKPENLVFIDEYLDKIQSNIERFLCIFCEKKFKNRVVLKEHMRKKTHKQVNPNNKNYDKYYVTNYINEPSNNKKRYKSKQYTAESEDPSGFTDNEEEDWSDWTNENISTTCLFCKESTQDFAKILEHMKSKHKFNFEDETKEFTFYQKVKIVNYIRKQIYINKCVYCDESKEDLSIHMDQESHCKLPQKRIWDQPEFFFPMFESDSFLYNLDTDSDTEETI
ncbi:hypothetical protein TSAR_000197, partial [Trichomalopsis sarcophagae]